MSELTLEDIRNVVREEVGGLRGEFNALGVKFEDLGDKVDKALEAISDTLDTKKQVQGHEKRVTSLETDNVLLKSTVKLHSQQLKAA